MTRTRTIMIAAITTIAEKSSERRLRKNVIMIVPPKRCIVTLFYRQTLCTSERQYRTAHRQHTHRSQGGSRPLPALRRKRLLSQPGDPRCLADKPQRDRGSLHDQ